MTDTPQAVADRYTRALLSVSAARRIEMACSMFGAAKAMALAGLRIAPLQQPTGERAALFLRIYGADFPEDVRRSVVAHLERAA